MEQILEKSLPKSLPKAGSSAKLRVVVKAQRIQLGTGEPQSLCYSGLWHQDENHEKIKAVILYYTRVDEELCGGDLAFLDSELDCDVSFGWVADVEAAIHGATLTVPVFEGTAVVFRNDQLLHRVKELSVHSLRDAAREIEVPLRPGLAIDVWVDKKWRPAEVLAGPDEDDEYVIDIPHLHICESLQMVSSTVHEARLTSLRNQLAEGRATTQRGSQNRSEQVELRSQLASLEEKSGYAWTLTPGRELAALPAEGALWRLSAPWQPHSVAPFTDPAEREVLRRARETCRAILLMAPRFRTKLASWMWIDLILPLVVGEGVMSVLLKGLMVREFLALFVMEEQDTIDESGPHIKEAMETDLDGFISRVAEPSWAENLRSEVLAEQLRPKDVGTFMVVSTGNGDCHDLLWATGDEHGSRDGLRVPDSLLRQNSGMFARSTGGHYDVRLQQDNGGAVSSAIPAWEWRDHYSADDLRC